MKKLIGFVLLCFGAIGIFFYLASPPNSNPEIKQFVVNQGDGLSEIALRLEQNKYIRNQYVFMFLASVSDLRQRLQAGSFNLSSSYSNQKIIKVLTEAQVAEYWFKIIDGQRLEELTIQFPKENEGYLFPDSYKIPVDYTPSQILSIISKNFAKNFDQAKANSIYSDQEIVTLASLIEREARTLESKKMVSGILQNRLKIGMALQVDASVQYARDSLRKPKTYWEPLLANDIDLVSPYNTYKNPGLPPSPICNPGLNSLIAAFEPTPSDYLFYITGNDNQMHYAKTLEEHNQNIAKYLK